MVDYIHANPVRRVLVEHPGEWPRSSWRFYESGEGVDFDLVAAAVGFENRISETPKAIAGPD